MVIQSPYLLFIGDVTDPIAAKTARAIVTWRPERCLGQLRLPGCKADLGVADMSVADAAAAGARTLIVGTVNVGGTLPAHWTPAIVAAIEAGMDVASGLHMKLADIAEVSAAAARCGRQLFDIRHPTRSFDCGTGETRSGKRLLTVGTDCSVGKMYTALAIDREMRSRGMNADFRATGQTGIFIADRGVCVDAVVSDFISGAVEGLAPAADPDHWDVIEGQGSLFHPSCAGVSLGLLHGAQADALVLCHEPTRTHMRGLPRQPLPGLAECMELNLRAARLTNPAVMLAAVSVNTSALSEDAGQEFLRSVERELDVPCVDPMRTGVARIVDRLA